MCWRISSVESIGGWGWFSRPAREVLCFRQDGETWSDAESTVPSISSIGAVKRRLSIVIDDSLACRTRSEDLAELDLEFGVVACFARDLLPVEVVLT
jgi:hypothetical protein